MTPTARRLVILGNSAAALSAIRAIRSRGGGDHLTVVSREECSAYSPVLTTYYLRGAIPEARLFLCDYSYYDDHDIECRFGRSAVALDVDAQTVALDDDSVLEYDALLIATGAAPTRPTGIDDDVATGMCYLRTIEDARRIKGLADRATRVAVLGAGLVSLQTASAVARPDLQVTCVVGSRQVLSQNLDAECAAIVREHVEREGGIEFLFGRSVAAVERCTRSAGDGWLVTLSSGEGLEADMVVVGKGVAPNMGFVDRQRIAVDAAIVVDDHLRTSVPNVYAAGDVAQGRNRITGGVELVANWIDACEQGRVAGLNMAGLDLAYPGSVPENVTTLFGLPVASIGAVRPRGDVSAVAEAPRAAARAGAYRRIIMNDGLPVGAVLAGDIGDVGVLRNRIVRAADTGCDLDEGSTGPLDFAGRLSAARAP